MLTEILQKEAIMYLHIEFTNHSNPYIFFGPHPASTTKGDCMEELKKWEKHFETLSMTETHGGIYVKMRERDSVKAGTAEVMQCD